MPAEHALQASPELQVLLWCLRGSFAQEEERAPDAMPQLAVDWQRFADLASGHGVLPLVTLFLRRCEGDLVPPAVLDGLQDRFRAVAVTNLHLTRELLHILDLFETNGLTAIPYKGPVLAHHLYGNVALRQFGDLDLLVTRFDAERAKDLLVSRGYCPVIAIAADNALDFFDYAGECEFERSDGGVHVELRWRLGHSPVAFPLAVKELQGRLEPVTLGGRTFGNLCAEDLLLVLCEHGSKHGWERLLWACDLAMLLRRPTLDWGTIHMRAKELGVRRRLLLGLAMVQEVLGLELPGGAWEGREHDPSIPRLLDEARARIFSERQSLLTLHRPMFWLSYQLGTMERLRDRIGYALHPLIKPDHKDWLALPLPPRLFPLYHLIHPANLLARQVRRAAHRAMALLVRGGGGKG